MMASGYGSRHSPYSSGYGYNSYTGGFGGNTRYMGGGRYGYGDME